MRRAVNVLLAAALAAVPLLAATPLDVPFVRQQKNGCGAASLAMVMHYWVDSAPQETAIAPEAKAVYTELYRKELRAIPLESMRAYAESHGFRAFTLQARPEDLENHLAKGRPLVIALRPKPKANIHFAVLDGMDENHVWLNDPTKGKPRKMKRAQFDRQWVMAGGWTLLISPR